MNTNQLVETWAGRCNATLGQYADDEPFTNLIDLLTDAMH